MSESTFKSGRKKGFIVLYREVAQDGRLSLEARGLFALMVSLPDNWEYTVSGLAVKAGCGRDKIRRLLRELQNVGYLIREQGHDQGGKFSANVYILQDEAPLSGNTVNGETRQRETPSAGFSTQKNKDLKEQGTKKNPKAPKGTSGRKSKFDLAEDAKPLLLAYVGGDRELHRALGDMIESRRELRAINSKRAIKILLDELDRLSGGSRANKLALLRRAITSSWKTVYPMRPDELPEKIPAGTSVTQAREGGLDCGFR